MEDETPSAPAGPTLETRLDQVIAAWLNERIYDSPVSRSTAAINHLRDELPELRRRLAAIL